MIINGRHDRVVPPANAEFREFRQIIKAAGLGPGELIVIGWPAPQPRVGPGRSPAPDPGTGPCSVVVTRSNVIIPRRGDGDESGRRS
jgi:hypothetical protein